MFGTNQVALATTANHATELHDQNIPFILIMDPCSPGYEKVAALSTATAVTSCGECAGERDKGHHLSCTSPQLSSYNVFREVTTNGEPYVYSPKGEVLLYRDHRYNLYVDSYPYEFLTWYEVSAHCFEHEAKTVVMHDLDCDYRVHLPLSPEQCVPNHMAGMIPSGFRLWEHG